MNKRYLTRIVIGIMLSLLFMTGCSVLRPIYGDSFHISRSKPRDTSHGEKSRLKMKVLAVPLINMAGLDDEKAGMLMESWTGLLKEDSSLLVTTLKGYEGQGTDISSLETGIIIDPGLIDKTEEMGMNILVMSVIEPLHYSAKKGIIWPFNDFKGEYEVSMVAWVADATTGTILFTFRRSEIIEMGEIPEGQTTPVELDQGTLDNVLSEIQRRLSSDIQDLLSGLDWRGKISLEDGKIRIRAGADIGVVVGDVFNVLEKGEVVKSINGRDYHIDGPKAGEIRVTDVMEDYSLAVPVGGGAFDAGQVITLKSE